MRFLPNTSDASVLDDFERKPYPKDRRLNFIQIRPRGVTVPALRALAGIDSIDEMKRAKGYMTASAYYVFAQCERKR